MKNTVLILVALCGFLFEGCTAVTSRQINTWYAGTQYRGAINTGELTWKCDGGSCILKGEYGDGLNMSVCQELSKKVGGLDYYYNDSGMTWSKTQNRSLLDQCNSVSDLGKLYDIPVQIIKREKPIYPKLLSQSGNIGHATIKFTIDKQGQVQNPIVTEATHPAFGEAALEATVKSQFRPAQKQGKPVETTQDLGYNFVLDNETGQQAYKISNDADQSSWPPEFQYDVPPKIKITIAPVYPANLLQSETTGTAKVSFLVGKDGRASHGSILSASHPDFGKATKAMIDTWIFEPATKAGLPTMSILTKEQVFKIHTGDIINQGTLQMLEKLEDNTPIHSLQELDNIPKPIFQVKPIYPNDLLDKKVTGKAVIKYFIDEEGRVQLPEIVTATNDDFAWAALTSVSRWRFSPPMRNAKAVIVRTESSIRFETK